MTSTPAPPPGSRPRWWRVHELGRPALLRLGIALFAAGLVGALVVLGMRLDALRALRATGPMWSFPSRVFSDGVTLAPGQVAPEPYVIAQLEARDYVRTAVPMARPGTWARDDRGLVVVLRGFQEGADPAGTSGPERVRVVFRDSTIAQVERLGGFRAAPPPDRSRPPRIEPALVSYLLGDDRVRRSYVTLERVPERVREAILASEDRRFHGHMGIDVRATARALVSNLRSGAVREGGSTITQQLARGLFLGSERTLTRKVAEIPLALGLETFLDKDQILEMYLNMVYWGQGGGGGVGGIAEAARWYFDAPVESLGTIHGALLAALIPAPNALDPFEDPERARGERNEVLEAMVETGKLEADEARRLAALPLGLRRGAQPIERFPSYTGYVREVLGRRIHRRAAESRGLSIFTTLDLAWQVAAESRLDAGIQRLGGRMGRRGNRLEGAFVALEPGTGHVRALVGGRRQRPGDFNRAIQARRQTGSAIKPIVYAAALLEPTGGFTPATTVPDEPRTFGKGRWAWTPRNEGGYHPSVTLANALALSLNVATANLVEAIGPWTVARTAERFGLVGLKPVASIGLGSNEVSLLDLTRAFAVFVDEGMLRDPTPLRAVVAHRGRRLLERPLRATDAIPPGIAALMTGLLQDVVRYGVASPLRWYYGFDRPVGGKTGTTDDFKDGWFVGFTPHVVAGVWVGYDRPRSLGRTAAATALPVWAWIVGEMVEGFPRTPFASDQDVEWRAIDPWTGYLAEGGGCPQMVVPFLPGTAPMILCGWESDTLGGVFEADTLGYTSDSAYVGEPIPDREPPAEDPPPDEPPSFEPEPEDTTWEEAEPDTSGEDPEAEARRGTRGARLGALEESAILAGSRRRSRARRGSDVGKLEGGGPGRRGRAAGLRSLERAAPGGGAAGGGPRREPGGDRPGAGGPRGAGPRVGGSRRLAA